MGPQGGTPPYGIGSLQSGQSQLVRGWLQPAAGWSTGAPLRCLPYISILKCSPSSTLADTDWAWQGLLVTLAHDMQAGVGSWCKAAHLGLFAEVSL